MSRRVRSFVLERDRFACQMCGAVADEEHHGYPGTITRLRVSRVVHRADGGSSEPENLRALCGPCYEGMSGLTVTRPDLISLLSHVNRATRDDQEKLFAWLRTKFEGAGKWRSPP
jgi:5-methylcytosine-specific restriction endonuclease McrA